MNFGKKVYIDKKIAILLLIFIIIGGVYIAMKYIDNDHKKLEITKDINAGIPFRWEYEIEDPTTVEFVKSYVVSDENKGGKVGGKVSTNYVFKGLKKGQTTITFKYVRFTENIIEKEEKYTVKVDNNLNISLVAIPNDK